MRLSRMLIATLREDPADAEIPSHRLLARGGYIIKVASGLYTYSPLMWRTLKKVIRIIREEIDREGGQEVMMPILHPKDLWESSGRWERYVTDGILFTVQDSKRGEFCLGPTHEEVVTTYAGQVINSYKQLPVNLYQIQDKFRDEIRPRYGLMRSREFLMMDAYSFDADREGLDTSYAAMDRAYRRVFERCGLQFLTVQADTGAIGGSGSEEFMVLADSGEDRILYCEESGYAANVEKARSLAPSAPESGEPQPLEKHATPDVRTIEQLERFFDMPAAAMAKTVLYTATGSVDEAIVAVMVRGDDTVNEVKLAGALDGLAVALADDATVRRVTGAEVGFAGPIGLPDTVRLLADELLAESANLLTGCNETGYHCTNVNAGRDHRVPEYHNLRLGRAGDRSPDDAGDLQEARGIEVGHIFKLGTKYSTALNTTFLGKDGKSHVFEMGCYGIGVTRTAQAAVEQRHDEKGIVWPRAIAPFEVVVAILDVRRDVQVALATQIYDALLADGVDACLDDRKMQAGVKFKDIDLLGFPYQVVVGRRAAESIVEIVTRATGEKTDVPAEEVGRRLTELLSGSNTA